MFEIGRIFLHRGEGELPEERNMLAGFITGKLSDDLWNSQNSADFYYLKGCVENIFYDLKISHCTFSSKNIDTFLHPGKSCAIMLQEKKVGFLGAIHPDLMEKIDFRDDIYVFEINLDYLADVFAFRKIFYQEISKYPSVIRDAAFIVPDELEAATMLKVILEEKEDLLENVHVFDVYKGKELPEGTKSIGLRFSYRASDRTLTDSEASAVHEKILQKTLEITGAKIRT